MKNIHGIEFQFKDPVKYDDKALKMLTCSHLEQDIFLDQKGNDTRRCKACGLWEEDAGNEREVVIV